ncbi:hypothetical protein SteCoe_8436 [Stentor coeruleus]|uniref:Uncharacterized protein n=1 Tax=Stentor coeruleus TaxID=5963 RepID=A0A1R2CKE5_9CILI|nr:hypothetical protein SteCoe_8436 [Stentor coeruleus]
MSGVTTKPYPKQSKDRSWYGLSKNFEESRRKKSLSGSISPCKNNPNEYIQSDFCVHRNHRKLSEAEIKVKLNRNFKSKNMSISFVDPKNNEPITYHLYYEDEIMNNKNLENNIQKLDADNDCSTNDIQIDLALRYIEAQLRVELGLNKKSTSN